VRNPGVSIGKGMKFNAWNWREQRILQVYDSCCLGNWTLRSLEVCCVAAPNRSLDKKCLDTCSDTKMISWIWCTVERVIRFLLPVDVTSPSFWQIDNCAMRNFIH
jgi:hypothetical protein